MSPGRMRAQARLLFLFAAFIAAAPVAFALAFTQPLYDFYEHAPKLWGLSPLEDQQIGAIGMAIEQAAILFAACSIAFMQWLDEDDAPPRPVGFPTMSTIRAACVQFSARADKSENVALMAPLVAEAAGRGADVVLLPEKWNAWMDGPRLRPLAERIDGRRDGRRDGRLGARARHQPDRRLDRDRRRRRGRPQRLARLRPRGERVAAYTKIHLFDVDVGGSATASPTAPRPAATSSRRSSTASRSA